METLYKALRKDSKVFFSSLEIELPLQVRVLFSNLFRFFFILITESLNRIILLVLVVSTKIHATKVLGLKKHRHQRNHMRYA